VRPPTAPPALASVRERYQLGDRHTALAVATNLPHKNLAILLHAISHINPPQRPLLVLAGHDTDAPDLRARAAAAGVAEDVRLLGALTTAELEGLYAVADCLVLPTLHEGFGLPVIEAMARSLPVACSDIPALREVAGEAALYFDPRSSAQIAAAIGELIGDPGTAARLRELGLERAAGFSWSAAAEGTLASYRRALAP